jgi:hypothetical protein
LSGLFSHRGHGGKSREEREEDSKRAHAAAVIQRTYRGYRVRREMKGLGLDASTRWVHALREVQFRELNRPRARGVGFSDDEHDAEAGGQRPSLVGGRGGMGHRKSSARTNWKKAATVARRAGNDADEPGTSDSESSSSDSSVASHHSRTSQEKDAAKRRREEARERRKKDAKTMGLSYFLEMVDLKHRYGSNLRIYHEEWKKADTNENFFYWLDHGEGRNIEIEACPRERLDRECVRYLSREERQHYLVKVDADGRLCWAKNGARIDTTEKWKDSIHGIVPADDPTPAYKPLGEEDEHSTRLLGDSSTGESSSDDDGDDDPHQHHHVSGAESEAAQAAKYATPGIDQAKGVKKVTHMSASTVFNKLLRKSVKKNTWIFVADTSFRLFVGIKNSGAFQHSSFLQGSRISAAGLIKIKNGRLTSLSPLSGHYRPPASNFRAFVKSLKEEGVDMSHVSISKSYAVLVGLEAYVKTRKKGKDILKRMTHRKDRIVAPEELRRKEEEQQDKSESAAKERKVLEEEEARREENSAHVKALQKLHIHPSEPRGQQGQEADGNHAGVVRGEAREGPTDGL